MEGALGQDQDPFASVFTSFVTILHPSFCPLATHFSCSCCPVRLRTALSFFLTVASLLNGRTSPLHSNTATATTLLWQWIHTPQCVTVASSSRVRSREMKTKLPIVAKRTTGYICYGNLLSSVRQFGMRSPDGATGNLTQNVATFIYRKV